MCSAIVMMMVMAVVAFVDVPVSMRGARRVRFTCLPNGHVRGANARAHNPGSIQLVVHTEAAERVP